MLLVAATANAFTVRLHPLPKDPRYPKYSMAEVDVAIQLVEKHYNTRIPSDVDVYILVSGVLHDNILGYYDFRGPTIWITTKAMDTTITRIYVLAHELGHHVMAEWESNDHCLMYRDEGYDHLVLADLGVENPYEDYIDPFFTLNCDYF